jgi:glycosyltransferase involved in cell wall biosynthesis
MDERSQGSKSKKIKILHIQLLCQLSGVQKVSLEILKNIGSDYEKYIVFSSEACTGNKEDTVKAFEEAGIKVILIDNFVREINIKKDIVAFKQIYNLCKKEKFDIVHTHSSKPGVLGRMAATMAGVPKVIHTVHGVSFTKYTPKVKWIAYYIFEMFASFFCDDIVLVNQYYRKYFWYCKKKIQTIYNAIDYSKLEIKEQIKARDYINLLYIGRLDTPKNPITLLKAVNKVNFEKFNIRLTIVGDGELMDKCTKFVDENDLSGRVIFEGWRSNIADYYQQADIFVSSSIYEAFGLTFLEAGYYKLPIIATNVEGIPEVVINGKTGLLSEPENSNALAENICILCENRNLREKMGVNGYEYVTRKFTIEHMASAYDSIYRNM